MSGTGDSSVFLRSAPIVLALSACTPAAAPVAAPDVPPIIVDSDLATTFARLRDAPPPQQFSPVGSEDMAPDVTLAIAHDFNRRLQWDVNLDGAAIVRIAMILTRVAPRETRIDVRVSFPESRLTHAKAFRPGDLAIITAASDAALTDYARAIVQQRDPDPYFSRFDRYLDSVNFDTKPFETKQRALFRRHLFDLYGEVTQPTADRIVARLGPRWYMIGQDAYVDTSENEADPPNATAPDDADTGLPPVVSMREGAAPTASAEPMVDVRP